MRYEDLKKWKWSSFHVYKECFLMKYWWFNFKKADSFNQKFKWCLSSCVTFNRRNESTTLSKRVTLKIEKHGKCQSSKLKIRWLSSIFSSKSYDFNIINKDTWIENILSLKWTCCIKCLTLKRTKISTKRINWNLIAILKVLFKRWQKQNYLKGSLDQKGSLT